MASWLMIGMFVVPILLIGVIVVFAIAAGRAKNRDDASPVVSVTLWLAAVWAVLALVGAVVALVSTLMIDAPTLTVPVAQYWPLPLPGVTLDGASADVVGGGFTEAELTIAGLSTAPRVLWAIGQFVGFLVPGAIAALIAVVCFQLLRGAAFAPLVARMAMITAVVVLVGGLATQVLCDIAGSMASGEALGFSASLITGYPDDWDPFTALPQSTLHVQIDFWPIAASLGFTALAAVFRYGTRLERDTELLV